MIGDSMLTFRGRLRLSRSFVLRPRLHHITSDHLSLQPLSLTQIPPSPSQSRPTKPKKLGTVPPSPAPPSSLTIPRGLPTSSKNTRKPTRQRGRGIGRRCPRVLRCRIIRAMKMSWRIRGFELDWGEPEYSFDHLFDDFDERLDGNRAS